MEMGLALDSAHELIQSSLDGLPATNLHCGSPGPAPHPNDNTCSFRPESPTQAPSWEIRLSHDEAIANTYRYTHVATPSHLIILVSQ